MLFAILTVDSGFKRYLSREFWFSVLNTNCINLFANTLLQWCSFILLRLNPLGQRKLPIVISLSMMLCFGWVYASSCALNVSAALQGAYSRRQGWKRFKRNPKVLICRNSGQNPWKSGAKSQNV